MEYEVIKDFTKYDYIIAHQKHYGWDSFLKVSSTTKGDINEWGSAVFYEHSIFTENPGPNFSKEFYDNGVKFGFLREVSDAPDKFYLDVKDSTIRVQGGKYRNDIIIDASILNDDKCFEVCLDHFNYKEENNRLNFFLKKK